MIPQCSPFLRCHAVSAKKKSMKHLDALLLPTGRFSRLISDFPLFNDTEAAHKNANGRPAKGMQRLPMGFQSHREGQSCGNSRQQMWCEGRWCRCTNFRAFSHNHISQTPPPPYAYTHLDQQKAAFWGGTIPGKTEGGVHVFQRNMVKNLMCSLQNPTRTVWVLMGNRTPVIKKDMTGFCFVWMQGKKWRFSVSRTAVCRKSEKLENPKNYYSCSIWMIFVVQTWHLCPSISAGGEKHGKETKQAVTIKY